MRGPQKPYSEEDKMIRRIASLKQIDVGIETLSKASNTLGNNVKNDSGGLVALSLLHAREASSELVRLGPSTIRAIGKLVTPVDGDYITDAVQGFFSPLSSGQESFDKDTVNYGLRCLRVYRTIFNYQEKAQELKRTQEIGAIFGEPQ